MRLLFLSVLSFFIVLSGMNTAKAGAFEFLSRVHEVTDIYKSMMGPWDGHVITLGDKHASSPELLWITGYKIQVVGEDGVTPMPKEFMCHSNLDLMGMAEHAEIFGWRKNISGRLFTLSQGVPEVYLPEGFGVPVMSNEPMNVIAQVLNLNPQNEIYKVRHKVQIDYVRDADLEKPMRPLYMQGAYGRVLVDDELDYAHLQRYMLDPSDVPTTGCSPGEAAAVSVPELDGWGRKLSGHWVVPPGREVRHSRVTDLMNLTFDTKIHYIAIHLHAYAESIELRDTTTNETVFKSNVTAPEDRVGIEYIDYYSDEEGLQLYKDHEYELISVYNNTTGQDEDSMATMFLYLSDEEFEKPDFPLDLASNDVH